MRGYAHLPRQLSREQVRALFRASQGNKWIALRDRALLLLFLRTGLPSEEVAHLKWQDLEWQAGSIRICSQKSGRERILPLSRDVGKTLAAYLRTFGSLPVCVFDSSRATFPVETPRLHISHLRSSSSSERHRYFDGSGVVRRCWSRYGP